MNRILKKTIKFVLYYSPQCVQNYLHSKVEAKEIHIAMERMKRTKVSKEELSRLIASLDLNSDVMLHTSMMNIGKLQGGIAFITNEFVHKIDLSKHTLVVSALPFRGAFKKYLEVAPVFDVRNAPIAMGAINEYVALLPEAKRSIHPTHSVVALGKNAEDYTATHHLDKTPFGVNSPYYRLIKKRAKIILFGATLENLTMIHAIEDLLGDLHPFKVYCKKIFEVTCIDMDGKRLKVSTTCHDPIKGMTRELSFAHDDMIQKGVMVTFPLGESELCVIDAYSFFIFYLNMLMNGRSIYGKFKPSIELKEYIDKLKNII